MEHLNDCWGTDGSQLTVNVVHESAVHWPQTVICGSVSMDPRLGEFQAPSDWKQFT